MPLGIVLLLVWLVLLVRYPRPMLPATAIIGVIALVIAAVAAVAQWRHERQVSQIEISIRHDPEHCEFGRPLRVEVHNRSTRTVTGMSWQLRASQAGYSFDLLTGEASRRTYLLDDILPADGRWQRCYPAPALRSGYRAGDLEYRADQVRAQLQR